MSNEKKVTLTSSEIISENRKNEEKIHGLEDKANKLAELVGSSVAFAPWEKKEATSSIVVEEVKVGPSEEEILAKKKAEEERLAAEEAARKAEEERLAAEEAARKAEEERLAAEEVARKAEEERLAAEKAAAEEVKVEETTPVVEEVKTEEVVPAKEAKKPTKEVVKKEFKKPQQKQKQQNNVSFTGYFEKVVGVKKISKTTKGGRHMRFSALVVIGDKNGTVGYGKGKSVEVPVAIRKALKDAKNNLRKVKINKNGTLFHEVVGKQGAGKVLIKPAPNGTGIIAGGPIRVVLELAGYKDVYSKNLGKNTSINMVLATLNGLDKIRSPKEIAFLRDKNLKDL